MSCEPLFDLVGIDMDYLILDGLAGVFSISICSEKVLVKNIISFCQKLHCGYEVDSVGVIFVKIPPCNTDGLSKVSLVWRETLPLVQSGETLLCFPLLADPAASSAGYLLVLQGYEVVLEEICLLCCIVMHCSKLMAN